MSLKEFLLKFWEEWKLYIIFIIACLIAALIYFWALGGLRVKYVPEKFLIP